MPAVEPQRDHSRAQSKRRPLLGELRGPWMVRGWTASGDPRFVKVADRVALAIMRCTFAHTVSWPVLWAIFWRQQTRHPHDPDKPVEISIDELVAQTGYRRSTVYLALRELNEREMLVTVSGGGRHRKSAYQLTDAERWLL